MQEVRDVESTILLDSSCTLINGPLFKQKPSDLVVRKVLNVLSKSMSFGNGLACST